MKSLKIGLLALLSAAVVSQAGVVTYTNTFSGTPTLSGSLALDKYHGSETVTQIVVSGSVTIQGFSLSVTNTSQSAGTINEYQYGVKSFFTNMPISAASTATVYDMVEGVSVAANSSTNFTGVTETSALFVSNGIIPESNFGLYTGAGTFDIGYRIIQSTLADLTGGLNAEVTTGTSSGYVQVQYFTAIPEPSMAMVSALGIALFYVRRRIRIVHPG